MKLYIVFAVRSRSGEYVTFEMITTDYQEAINHYESLKSGEGNQEDYPSFDWREFQLDISMNLVKEE